MNNKLFTITDTANILGVSTKTLRRWDQRGRFVPTRTVGNQRRYTQTQIDKFRSSAKNAQAALNAVPQVPPVFSETEDPKEFKATHSLPSVLRGLPSGSILRDHFLLKHASAINESVSSSENPEKPIEPTSFARRPPAKLNPIKMGFVFASLVLLLSLAGAFVLAKYDLVAGLAQKKDQFAKFINNLPQVSFQIGPKNTDLSFVPQANAGAVLAAAAGGTDLALNINVPAFFSQNVGIGTATPDASAILDLVSQDKGFLAPRMTTAQRDTIANPATGLFVYNTDTNRFNMYSGTSWGDVGAITAVGDVTTGDAFTATGTGGTSLYFYDADGRGKLTIANLSGVRTYTLPDASGEVSLLGQTIGNSELVNSKVTVSAGTNMTGGGEVALGSSITLTLKDSISLSGTLTAAGATALNGNVGLGDAATDTITFTGRVAEGSDLIPIGTTGANDLGTSSLPWDNLYADNVFPASSGTSGYWQRNSSALSPTNITDDVLIGATSTSSAKIAFINIAGGTPTATISGDLTLDSAGVIRTTKLQTLTIGGTTTGNIVIDSGSSAITLSDDVTATGDLAVNGGDLTTTAATFNFVNAATTLNIGSTNIARTVNLGTGTEIDTINIGTGATGVDVIRIGQAAADLALTDANWSITTAGLITTADDLAVNGADITTTATTFALVNTTATTLNVGGAATTLSIGAATGTATINNATTAVTGNLTIAGTTGITSSGVGSGITFSGTGNHDITASAGTLRLGAFTATGTQTLATGIDILAAGAGSDLGSSTTRLATVWADTVNGTNLTGTVTGGSTSSSDWLINSGNTTEDTSNGSLTFERGNPATNTQLLWNSTTKQLSTNSPSFAILPDSAIAYSGTSALMVNQIQAQDIFTASASGTTRFTVANSGDTTIVGDLAVNGATSADITSTTTTGTLFNATVTTLSLGGAATTALNIGNGNTAYTAINIGSGTGGNTINIAGTGATGADTINIGTGGTGADTLTIGNNASTTSLAFTSGTGSQIHTSSVATGTTTTSANVFTDTALTSGTLIYGTSSSLTSGILENLTLTGSSAVATAANSGSILTLTSTTTGFTGATQRLAGIYSSGANTNASAVVQGLAISVTNTGTTNTNTALSLTASGATTNYGLLVTDGFVGIGDTTPAALLTVGSGDLFQVNSNGSITQAQAAVSGGQLAVSITPGAHTAVTAEVSDLAVLAHTNTITGAYTTQRFNRFMIPTISAATALTVTNAATLYVEGAATAAGAGPAAITNNYALWVDAGITRTDDDIVITDGAATPLDIIRLDSTAGGATVFNEQGADIDFRIESDTNGNMFTLDAGLFTGVGNITMGAVANNTGFVVIDNPAFTSVASTNIAKLNIENTNALTVPTGTTAIAASLFVGEPNLTATGTITNAVTAYIEAAPTEGGTGNYALWVDAGTSRFDGNLNFQAGAVDLIAIANTVPAFRVTDGTIAYYAIDTRTSVPNEGIHNFDAANISTASVSDAAAPMTMARFANFQMQWTNGTQVTTLGRTVDFAATTLTATVAKTINAVTTIAVAPPTESTNITLTDGSAIRISNGSTSTNQYGIYIESLTLGASDYGLYIAGADTNAIWVDAGITRLDGTLQLGIAGTTGGVMNFQGSTSGVVTIQPAAAAGTYTLTLPTDDGTASQFLQTDGAGILTWATASTPLSSITAATATNTIANANWAQTWNWGTLTTQTGMTFGGGTAMTTGSIFALGGATYVHTAAETGSLASITFTDASTLAVSGNSITNGLNIASTINTSGATGTKEINAITIASPTKTACTGGACTWTGLRVADPGTLANTTFYAATFAGGNVGIGTTAPGALLSLGLAGTTKGVINFAGNTSGVVTIQPAATAGTYTLTLPQDDGTAGQVLETDGAGILSWGADAGTVTFTRFTTSLTWTKAASVTMVYVEAFGAGGGGGGGEGRGASTERRAGAGGGGGARAWRMFPAATLGTTESVAIGGEGASGGGGTSANGSSGGSGGNSTFGARLTAYGGGLGGGGNISGRGGGGAGAGAAGGTLTDNTGGGPGGGAINASTDGYGGAGGGGGDTADTGGSAVFGGGGGAGSAATTAGNSAGSSIASGAGGGSGGGVTTGNAESAGGVGGGAPGTGGAGGGGASGAIDGGAGGAGITASEYAGPGGGGGGSQASGTGGAGGAGGAPSGGGGGGGAGTSSGGAGGTGGRGEVRIWEW